MPVQYERGKKATLYATFSSASVPVDPVDLRVSVYKGNTVIIAPTMMTKISIGYYFYEFYIPDGMAVGFYSALYTGKIGGVSFKNTDIFEVIDTVIVTTEDLPTDTYCTLGDVKNELLGIDLTKLPGIDARIIALIPIMEHRVDYKTQRTFKEHTTTAYLDGNGMPKLLLPFIPIKIVSECKLRVTPNIDWHTFKKIAIINTLDFAGNSIVAQTPDTDVRDSDLVVDSITGEMSIPERVIITDAATFPFWNHTFIKGRNNVKVTWTFGYSSTTRPPDIRYLTAKVTALQVLQNVGEQLGKGAMSLSVDGYSKSYGGKPFIGRIEMLQREIEEIVTNYRRIGIGIG